MTPKRKRNSLSAVFVRSVQKAGTYLDGGGLNLRVEDSGTKYWFQRVTIDGKRRNLGLGGYPTVSLAEARKAALANSRMIREGRDPLAEKREAIAARQRPPTPTFAAAAEIVIEMRRPSWTNAKHAGQWTSTLATYAHPVIGDKLVSDITSADILAVLSPMWMEKPETASRVRQRAETVCRPGLSGRQPGSSLHNQGVAEDAANQAAPSGAALPRRAVGVGKSQGVNFGHRHQVGV